jgi:hypothetical protein
MSSNFLINCLSLQPSISSYKISKSKTLITKNNKNINIFNSIKNPILKQHSFKKYSNIVLKNINNINANNKENKQIVLSTKELVSQYYNIEEDKFSNIEKYNEFVDNINKMKKYNLKIGKMKESYDNLLEDISSKQKTINIVKYLVDNVTKESDLIRKVEKFKKAYNFQAKKYQELIQKLKIEIINKNLQQKYKKIKK